MRKVSGVHCATATIPFLLASSHDFPTIQPPMTAIAAIDAQIARLESHSHDDFEQGRLLELRKERNALTPFGKVPDEIISHILAEMILQPSWNPYSFFHLESFAINQEWTRAMLLCSRIRSVALATRELWSYIDCSAHPSWIVLCLQRVGNASLTLMRIRSHIRSMIYAITDSPSDERTSGDSLNSNSPKNQYTNAMIFSLVHP
jgi:hypothetical protein